ncbi:hypothetical protein BSE24067_01888 [Burkholderia seminalis]|nr:hypothetical protein BSE24067_01888 [Burkholderia seminalis]
MRSPSRSSASSARGERALVDHAEPARQLAEHQVLRDRQLGHQMQLLVDDRDAGLERRARRREALDGAVQRQRAGLRLVHAGQHLQQRRLARAVLAHQPVHFARAHRQRHRIERAYARERHGDAVEREQRAVRRRARFGVVAGHGRHRLRRHRVLASPAQIPSSARTACQFARVISLPLVCVSAGGVLPLRIQSTRFCVLSLPWLVELTAIVP